MFKKILFCLIGIICVLFVSTIAEAQIRMSARQAIIYYATRGDVEGLKKLQSQGHSIDIEDKNKQTPLCEVVSKNDEKAIQTLIKAGANVEASCMKSLANTEILKNAKGIATGLSTTTKVAIGAGIVALAGGAAAAGGGGGSSSGESNDDNGNQDETPVISCKNGATIVNGQCQCTSGWTGTTCEEVVTCPYATTYCTDGYEKTGNQCKSGETTYYECKPKSCDGYTEACSSNQYISGTCKSGENTLNKCETYSPMPNCSVFNPNANSCQTCNEGWTGATCETPATCSYTTIQCTDGYEETGNQCKSGETIYRECMPKLCSGYVAACNDNQYVSGTCKSGENTLNKCEPYTVTNCATFSPVSDECASCTDNRSGSKCDYCTSGYVMENGLCAIDIGCKNGGIQSNGQCFCTPSWTGATCETAVKLGSNGEAAVLGKVAEVNNGEITLTDEIKIKDENSNDKILDMYGLYSKTTVTNAYGTGEEASITIINNNSNMVAGIYSEKSAYNADDSGNGTIDITNKSNGDVYGLWGNSSSRNVSGSNYSIGLIKLLNQGTGSVYGMYVNGESSDIINAYNANGTIRIINKGTGSAYGMWGNRTLKNTSSNSDSKGFIKLLNQGTGVVYGMYGREIYNETNVGKNLYSTITLVNIDSGVAIGTHSSSSALNKGDITIHNLGTGTAIGMYATDGTVENSGNITITRANYRDDNLTDYTSADDTTYAASTRTGGMAVGIYGASGTTIINSGNITIDGANKAYGIWAEDDTVTVSNTGTITIDDIVNTTTGALSGNKQAIVLNGGTLFNDGVISADNLNTDVFGGTVVASAKSRFIVKDALSGTITAGLDNVLGDTATTFTMRDAIQANDTTGLKLASQSAMFTPSLVDGKDIVLTMKSFDEMTDNKSLASFLDKNYALGNNEAFFNNMKAFEGAGALTNALDSISGMDTLTRFTNEDLTAMREVNLKMNDMMFTNDDKAIYENAGTISSFGFKNDSHSSAQYALANKRISPRLKIGYAMATTNMRSDDDNDNTRSNALFQVFMPISYNRAGWKMITTPQMGYARGHYTRQGYQGSYDGVLEKRIFALTNEARYPIDLGGFELAPTIEFNTIAYNQQGGEDKKMYALTMPSDNNLSVEAGVGLHAKKSFGKLDLTAGLMAYREFADPYNIKLGMHGMTGTFDLYDEVSDYRGMATFGFDYDVGSIDMYGLVQHYMEKDTRTNVKAGFKFEF